MSASLVGSEMCIRDRGGEKRGTPLPGTPHRKPPTPKPAPVPAEGGEKACLLYTSDAADDM
eukprot:5208309-Alexandrium_andersonii.AAC.1